MKHIKLFEEMNESDAPSDGLVKGEVYKIYDREDNGKLYKRAARFDGLDGKKGNKFALVNMPTESYIWIEPDKMNTFLFTRIEWKTDYKKKR